MILSVDLGHVVWEHKWVSVRHLKPIHLLISMGGQEPAEIDLHAQCVKSLAFNLWLATVKRERIWHTAQVKIFGTCNIEHRNIKALIMWLFLGTWSYNELKGSKYEMDITCDKIKIALIDTVCERGREQQQHSFDGFHLVPVAFSKSLSQRLS